MASSLTSENSVRVSVLIRRDSDPELFDHLQNLPYGGMPKVLLSRLRSARTLESAARLYEAALDEQRAELAAAREAMARETSRLAWLAAQFEALLAQSGRPLSGRATTAELPRGGMASQDDAAVARHQDVASRDHTAIPQDQRAEAGSVPGVPAEQGLTSEQRERIASMAGAFD